MMVEVSKPPVHHALVLPPSTMRRRTDLDCARVYELNILVCPYDGKPTELYSSIREALREKRLGPRVQKLKKEGL